MDHDRYDRLSAQDASFLIGENRTRHMHVVLVHALEVGPLRAGHGGIDFPKVRAGLEALLPRMPRYRQKLEWIPLFGRPVWVDDAEFNLDYHVRHTSLPSPGGMEQLKNLTAWINNVNLDRDHPLWEFWVAEGLEGDRFALITKMHHCMVDGKAMAERASVLFSTTPQYQKPEAPPPFRPPPPPGPMELLKDEVLLRLAAPLRAARSLRRTRGKTAEAWYHMQLRLKALQELAAWAWHPTAKTPLNQEISSHRRVSWLKMGLQSVKDVAKACGCTVNDVVLSIASGAFRDYMIHRGLDPTRTEFRISSPVNVRRERDEGKPGNRVSSWIVRMPIGEADPQARIIAIREQTIHLKESCQALGVETVLQIAEWTPNTLLSLGAQATSRPINSIVTNVPGPQYPLYLFGARLLEFYPVVPLLENMGLTIAVFSYDGKLFWGFNADYFLVPDLEIFAGMVERAFQACLGIPGKPAGRT